MRTSLQGAEGLFGEVAEKLHTQKGKGSDGRGGIHAVIVGLHTGSEIQQMRFLLQSLQVERGMDIEGAHGGAVVLRETGEVGEEIAFQQGGRGQVGKGFLLFGETLFVVANGLVHVVEIHGDGGIGLQKGDLLLVRWQQGCKGRGDVDRE